MVLKGRAAYLAALLFFACSNAEKDDPKIARAYNELLYRSDIERILPEGVSAEDSTKLVITFVNNWVKERAELAQAKLNLSDQQKDFDEQLESYYNSLVTYTYENKLVRQKLDTEVTEEEIHEHYISNQKEFELRNTIVKVRYLCATDLGAQELKIVKRSFFSEEEGAASEVRVICEQQGAEYFDGSDQWQVFGTILEKLQFVADGDPDELLKTEKHELNAGDRIFFIHFVDHKLKDSLSPLSLERDRIRDVILNKRKIELIETMQKDLLEKALKIGDVQIYK
jgi:hypothetical protein